MANRDANDRILTLLHAIVTDEGVTPLMAQAATLGLPPSTTYRMVKLLLRHGLLTQVNRGYYVAGFALADLAAAADPRAILTATARPPLRRLAREMNATAHLGIWDGDMVTYLVKEQGRCPEIFTREGGQLEGYCSAIGKVLLANLPPGDRDAYLESGPFVALTPHTITDPARIRTALLDAAANDCAIDNQEIAEGLYCVAVPVRRADGFVMAAISLSRSEAEHSPAAPPGALIRCAQAIGSKLGHCH